MTTFLLSRHYSYGARYVKCNVANIGLEAITLPRQLDDLADDGGALFAKTGNEKFVIHPNMLG
jgi:hypothetical protein